MFFGAVLIYMYLIGLFLDFNIFRLSFNIYLYFYTVLIPIFVKEINRLT